MKLKHEELIQECITNTHRNASEEAVIFFDDLLSLADDFESMGRRHRENGLPALSTDEFEVIGAKKFRDFPDAIRVFTDLIATYYMKGYKGIDHARRRKP